MTTFVSCQPPILPPTGFLSHRHDRYLPNGYAMDLEDLELQDFSEATTGGASSSFFKQCMFES